MLYDNPQFVVSVKKIIRDLLEPRIDSEHAEQNPNNEGGDTLIATVTELRTQIPIRIKTEADDSKAERAWKWIKGVLEVLGILAVISYTILANKQWHEMISARHQTQPVVQAAQESATAADNAFTEQRDSDRIEHRPYIVAGSNTEDPYVANFHNSPSQPSSWKAEVYFKNFGRSIGMQLKIGCRVTFGKDAIKKAHGFVPWAKIGEIPVAPGESVFHTCESIERPSVQEMTVDANTDYYLVVFGQLLYLDMWDKSPIYYSDFCYLHLANGMIGKCPDWHYVMR